MQENLLRRILFLQKDIIKVINFRRRRVRLCCKKYQKKEKKYDAGTGTET